MQLSLIIPLGGKNPLGPKQKELPLGIPEVEYLLTASETVSPKILKEWETLGFRIELRQSPRGEGLRQMASKAKGDTLLFLHADTKLPPQWLSQIKATLQAGHHWGAFRLGFRKTMGVPHRFGARFGLGLVAWGANLRSQLGLPFGDQAPFFDKGFYLRLGGHPSYDLMDDYVLSKKAAMIESPAILSGKVRTSPHRYLHNGILKTVLENRSIIHTFEKNRSAEELAKTYYQ